MRLSGSAFDREARRAEAEIGSFRLPKPDAAPDMLTRSPISSDMDAPDPLCPPNLTDVTDVPASPFVPPCGMAAGFPERSEYAPVFPVLSPSVSHFTTPDVGFFVPDDEVDATCAAGSSTKVFHSWHAGHCPIHFADS